MLLIWYILLCIMANSMSYLIIIKFSHSIKSSGVISSKDIFSDILCAFLPMATYLGLCSQIYSTLF